MLYSLDNNLERIIVWITRDLNCKLIINNIYKLIWFFEINFFVIIEIKYNAKQID